MEDEQNCRWLPVLLGAPGIALAAIWGFAEGTLFFIVPDLVITLTALFSIKRAIVQSIAITLGAILAGFLMYSWSIENKEAASESVLSVPLVKEEMVTTVRESYDEHGVVALLTGPLNGIPYKLYAIEAPEKDISLPKFLIVSFPARMERLASGLILFGAIGYWQRKRTQRAPNVALFGWACYWIAIYIAYIFLI